MPNNRIFYACQAVFIGKTGHTPAAPDSAGKFLQGVQSVGITSNFTLDQAFELGQIENQDYNLLVLYSGMYSQYL